jgi:hypothetical protein
MLSGILAEAITVRRFSSDYELVFGKVQPREVRLSLKRALTTDRDQKAESMVVERTYVDRDFTASYYMQAGRAFMPTDKNAQRVHFFSSDLRTVEKCLASFDDPELDKLLQDTYLGFAVIRPDGIQTLGRTLIAPPERVGGVAACYGALGHTRVSLHGHRLGIWACPYMSQDGRVLACATAAFWMATLGIAGREDGGRACSTAEITQMANGLHRGFGPRVGQAGLSVEQMERALVEMGFDPLVLSSATPDRLRNLLMSYCDGGLPPILVVKIPGRGLHAMTVIGRAHAVGRVKYTRSKWPVLAGSLPGDIILHDDQQGMYLAAEIMGTRQSTRIVLRGSGLKEGILETVLVPVPYRIMADLEDVHAKLRQQIPAIVNAALQADPTLVNLTRPMVARPIVVRSRDFKEGLASRCDMPDCLKKYYRQLPMPRFIWLVELAFADQDVSFGPFSPMPCVFGELIFDTTMPDADQMIPLAAHAAGVVTGLAVEGHDRETWAHLVPKDRSYAAFRPPAMVRAG